MPTLTQAQSWYKSSDGVHDFEHVQRVYHMASRLAPLENADLEIVQAAALLHDVSGSEAGGTARVEHHIDSAEFARPILDAEGWPPERVAAVQHCIRTHRFRNRGEAPQTIEAKVLFDADKLDVLGAIGVARTIAYAVVAGQPIYAEPSRRFLESGEKEDREPHSAYHEHLFKLVKIKERLFTDSARNIASQRHQYLCSYFKRLGKEVRGEL